MENRKFNLLRSKIHQLELKMEKLEEKIACYQLLVNQCALPEEKEILQSKIYKIRQEMDELYVEIECMKTELEILAKYC